MTLWRRLGDVGGGVVGVHITRAHCASCQLIVLWSSADGQIGENPAIPSVGV